MEQPQGTATAFDWAHRHLPSVALHLISEKLPSITDYARFRAVCSPWRLASDPKPRCLPLQLPWLMIPYVNTQKIMHGIDEPDDGTRPFYDLRESKMRKIHIPCAEHKVLGVHIFEPEFCAEYKFFVLGKSGLYLVSAANLSRGGQEEESEDGVERVPNQRVVMYKIQDPEGRRKVERITATSDTTIFYGDNYNYLAVSADEWDSLSGASMYMEYMYSPLTQFGDCKVRCTDCYDILFARLSDDESQLVANGIGLHASVYPPLPAMWFQASFV